MNAIDETWFAEANGDVGNRAPDYDHVIFEGLSPERATLAAAAPDLARALREMLAAYVGDDIRRRAAAYMRAEVALEKAGVP